jgi:molybdopterin biosynthesis enzyme
VAAALIMGMVRETPVIGVPGYPVSAALTGRFYPTLLLRWLGQPVPHYEHITAT